MEQKNNCQIFTKEFKHEDLKKLRLKEIYEIAKMKNIPYFMQRRKKELIDLIVMGGFKSKEELINELDLMGIWMPKFYTFSKDELRDLIKQIKIIKENAENKLTYV